MRPINVLALSAVILLSPLFVFAQSTTTATTTQSDLETQINQLINDRTNLIPTAGEIRTNAIRDYLKITTNPTSPKPSEKVNVTVESFLTDLNKATISWYINGTLIKRGTGGTTFSFQNGASGATTRLKVSIVTNAGEAVTKELLLNPVGVTILWEAETYTPPFYKGKPLMTPQAQVRAIAIPDSVGTSNALNAGNLVYVWKEDGTTIPEASGYGKNSFSFPGPKPFGNSNISVETSSLNDAIKSESKINLPLSQPFILFYENHPLLGTWYNHTLGTNLTLPRKEFSITSAPFFFSKEQSETPTLEYRWLINGNQVTNTGNIITVRNETGQVGNSSLTLAMRGLLQTFQSASQQISISFTPEEVAQPTF